MSSGTGSKRTWHGSGCPNRPRSFFVNSILIRYNKIMNDKEILEFEDRAYVSPTISRDEQMEFIDNYRNVLNSNVQRINTQTHNLGTDVPSNLGGLTGADATFESRYVTPQADAAISELRAKAQETALTQALNNLKAQMNKRYKDAYRKARISEYNKNNTPEQANPLGLDTNESDDDEIDINDLPEGYEKGHIYPNTNSVSDYYDTSGNWWQLSPVKQFDTTVLSSPMITPHNDQVLTQNGVTYLYIDNDQLDRPTWYRATRSAGPGTYSPKE